MDPVSQALVGASVGTALRSVETRADMARYALLAGLSGLAPDLDVLIRSATDPLLFLEYHRQFTHSLLFAPFGAGVVWLLARPLFARSLPIWPAYLVCVAGFGSHGLLDACTSYGTSLLWPFSDERIAWNLVSIVDPLLTIIGVGLLGVGVWRGRRGYCVAALVWILSYLLVGVAQRERAEAALQQLAAERNHVVERALVKPSFANLLLWKAVYESNGRFYVDALRLGLEVQVYAGESIERLRSDLTWTGQQARDLQRFSRFSQGYVARSQTEPNRIIDVRYSMLPNEIDALWSIELRPQVTADQHVLWRTSRQMTRHQREQWLRMLRGQSE